MAEALDLPMCFLKFTRNEMLEVVAYSNADKINVKIITWCSAKKKILGQDQMLLSQNQLTHDQITHMLT